ncbi:MAG: hypothetical protein EZS28_039917, partial [Streblomastix strix]
VRYTRALLAAGGKITCSMVQNAKQIWIITILANILAIQLNWCEIRGATEGQLKARVNFNAEANTIAPTTRNMEQENQLYYGRTADGPENSEHLKFWLGFSTAYGPFKYDSPLESIIAGKRHCGVFIDIPLSDIDKAAANGTPFFYLIPYDITFSVLTRNFASLYLQLWVQDFHQDLKIVWLNKSDTILNRHFAYVMIPPEKPDIVFLLSENEAKPLSYEQYTVRLVNMQNVDADATQPQNSISQISDAKFEELEIQNALFMTFVMPQYPTWNCRYDTTKYIIELE